MTAQETIEKIRAEVGRQEKQCLMDTYEGRHKLFILGYFKTFLSDLEKECSIPNDLEKYASRSGFDYVDNIVQENPGHRWNDHDVEFAHRDGIIAGAEWQREKSEKPTSIDFGQELYKHFGQVKDFTLGLQIGKYFYELGKQEKPTTAEGLEEEVKAWHKKHFKSTKVWEYYSGYYLTRNSELNLARHFARWGAEHLRDTTKKMSEDLEKLRDLTHEVRVAYERGIEVGRKEQKEQMMKEAVEGEVTETCGISSVWIKTKQFKPGQKVKLIIVKED